MALRTKERARVVKENGKKSSVDSKEQEVKECSNNNSRVLDERKPLLEENKEKYKAIDTSNAKEKQRKKRNDEAVNTPILVNLKNKRQKEEEKVSQIRTYPPSPQCFSVKRGATKARTPKAFRSRPQERGILQELKQTNKDIRKEQPADKGTHGKNVPIAAEREARTMDLFWV